MEHKDNLGNDITLHDNEVKLMSAGSGLMHGGTCYNHTNFFQIWVSPNEINTPPTVHTHKFSETERLEQWQLQVSPHKADGVLTIKQSIYVYRGLFKSSTELSFKREGIFKAFLMPIYGAVLIHNQKIDERDSAEFEFENSFSFQTITDSDLWLMIENK